MDPSVALAPDSDDADAVRPASARRSAARRQWVPFLILISSVLISAGIAYFVNENARTKDHLRFNASAERTRQQIDSRIHSYVTALRGVSALFAAQKGEVSREEFRDYVSRLRLGEYYSGIQAIGYSRRVPAQEREKWIADVHRELPDFKLWPAPDPAATEFHSIVYIEPTNRRNQIALGYDMFREGVRRAAMDRAWQSGVATASARVTLVQEIDAQKQPGFLIYFPLYAGRNVPTTETARQSALTGFVYGAFRSGDLVSTILPDESSSDLKVDIYDGATPDPASMLYSSDRADDSYESRFTMHKVIEVCGQPWTLVFAARPQFEAASGRWLAPFILCGGLGIGLVLFLISGAQARARESAERVSEELRISEKALRASESRFRRLVDSNLIGVVFCNVDGRVTDGNDEYFRIIGHTREEALAGLVRSNEITPAEFTEVDRRAAAELQQFNVCAPYEKEFIRPDGQCVSVLLGIAMLEGSATECVAFVVDLEDRKRVETELHAAKESAENANRAKDQFLAVLSHELRTPLTPVLAAAGAHKDDADLPDELRQDLAMVHRNVELEARLIDDLLDLTKLGRGKMRLNVETVDLHQAIVDAIDVCRRDEIVAKRLELKTDLRAADHHARGDAARLRQVFWNLVQNAIKYSPSGGRIEVTTTNESPGNVTIRVNDTGIGIDPDVLPRVFDAFEQGESPVSRRGGGLGLGLAITKGLVDAHGGRIGVRSQGKGTGSSFIIELPTVAAPEAVGMAPETKPEVAATRAALLRHDEDDADASKHRPLRILLVEDHVDSARILSRLLRGLGHDVTAANNMATGVELGLTRDFDLLISDLGLPDGSGVDLMRELRTKGRDVKGIALTGYGMDEDLRRTAEAGFLEHLTKPINFERLQAAMQKVVGV